MYSSDIARLFNSLSSVSPVLIIAKLIILEFSQHQLDWNTSIPIYMYTRWFELRNELPSLKEMSISCRVKFIHNSENIRFCDTNQKAYGMYIYISSWLMISNNVYCTEMLYLNSRSAPLKSYCHFLNYTQHLTSSII